MGEHKQVFCEDCKEYVDIQKMYFPDEYTDTESWFEEAFRQDWNRRFLKKMMAFMSRHQGCDVTLLGEYGGTQRRFFEKDDEEYTEWPDD